MGMDCNQFLKSGAILNLSENKFLVGYGERKEHCFDELDLTKPAFYFSDFFFRKSRPWIQYQQMTELTLDQLQNFLKGTIQLKKCQWRIDQKAFEYAFIELQRTIQNGKLKKAVPYIFSTSLSLMDEDRLHNSLQHALLSLKINKRFLYGMWNESSGLLGITPETLFSYDSSKNKVLSMALAGTFPIGNSPPFISKKEDEEHYCVVEGITQALDSFGEVKVGERALIEFPKLYHLMTPIEVTLKEIFSYEAIVQSLHPTPALGTYPIDAGREWLIDFDKHTRRDYFGAPVGFYDHQSERAQCYVAIRNVQWDATSMRLGAGCGIVAQSNFEQEWQEVLLKLQTIKDQLDL